MILDYIRRRRREHDRAWRAEFRRRELEANREWLQAIEDDFRRRFAQREAELAARRLDP